MNDPEKIRQQIFEKINVMSDDQLHKKAHKAGLKCTPKVGHNLWSAFFYSEV